MAVYFPQSLQRIGDGAFANCHCLITAELSPAVQIDDNAFIGCRTLEIRQPQVDYNSLTRQQIVQRSLESIRYLKHGFDDLLIHKICNDPNTTLDQLQSTIDKKKKQNK